MCNKLDAKQAHTGNLIDVAGQILRQPWACQEASSNSDSLPPMATCVHTSHNFHPFDGTQYTSIKNLQQV